MTVNAGCGGYRPVPDFDPGDLQQPHALEGTPLTRLWRSRPVRGPSAPMAVDEVNVYLGGSDRRVVAVDLASGKTRWAVRVPGPLVGGILVQDSLVYAATDRPGGKVYALRSVSGNELWNTGTGYIQAPLLRMDRKIIALTRNGQVMALDAFNGKIRWRKRLPSGRVPPVALSPERFVVTSFDSIYVVQLTDGKVTTRRRAPGTIVAPWVRSGNRLITVTADSLVVALSADSLQEQWRARLDAPLLNSPAVRGDTVYCVTQTGSLYRILPDQDPLVLRLQSTHWAATGAPALIGSSLLAGSSDGSLRAFELTDGAEQWHTPLGRPMELAPVALPDGSFLVIGGRGDLHRIRP